jgi:hypothetical protein
MERRRVEKANASLFSERCELMVHIVYQQVVAAVVQNGIDGHRVRNADQEARRVARDSDVTNLSFLLQSAHRGYGLFNDLLSTAELNIMGKQQIDIIGPQSRQRLFEALSNLWRREIKVSGSVAPTFR